MVRGGVSSYDARAQARGLLSRAVGEQGRVMSYLDTFWIYWILALAALPVVLLMKKAVAKEGATVH